MAHSTRNRGTRGDSRLPAVPGRVLLGVGGAMADGEYLGGRVLHLERGVFDLVLVPQ
jgi:hypothetical protein